MAFNQGYSVAAKHGRFYTNLEDKDRTVAVDLKTHEIVATWNPACGGGGRHGLGLDVVAGHLARPRPCERGCAPRSGGNRAGSAQGNQRRRAEFSEERISTHPPRTGTLTQNTLTLGDPFRVDNIPGCSS